MYLLLNISIFLNILYNKFTGLLKIQTLGSNKASKFTVVTLEIITSKKVVLELIYLGGVEVIYSPEICRKQSDW